MEPLCVACCSSPKSDQRRNLGGATSGHILPVLREIVEECYTDPAHLQYFGLGKPSGAVVCKKCFRQLEKLLKIRKEQTSLKKEMLTGIERVGQHFGIAASTSISRSPVKRPPEYVCSSPPKKKRLTYDTPERQALASIVSPQTPLVSVLVKKRQNARVFRVSSSLKSLGRSVGRRNRRSIARQAVRDKVICSKVIKYLGDTVAREMKKMCAKSTNSILRKKDLKSLEEFKLGSVITEMEKHAPTTLSLLRSCLSGRRPSRASNVKRKGRTKSRVLEPDRVVGVCCAILLRGRSQRMNILQRLVSILLYGGHASKRVYTRLQKLLFCVSHKTTISSTNTMGENYDAEVLNWRENIISSMQGSQIEPAIEIGLEARGTNEIYPDRTESEIGPERTADDPFNTSTSSLDSEHSSPAMSPLSGSDAGTSSSMEESHNIESSSSDFSCTDLFGDDAPAAPKPGSLKTFRLVGDNYDMNIKPRDMRSDHQTRSLHYYHCKGVRDRIDLTNFDDSPSLPNLKDINTEEVLPTSKDERDIRSNFGFLVARVLRKYMPFFKKIGKGTGRRLRHEYSSEMGQKSEVIPLGMILQSEISYDGMVAIMERLHTYVPTVSTPVELQCPNSDDADEPITVMKDDFHYILKGGDQLTVARARGSKRIRSNSLRPLDRLEGLIPVCEDWHTRGCFVNAMWKQFYKTSSGRDGGTVYQLRNLINRRSVVKKPIDNLDACEDFIVLVTEAHILSAAMTLFKMENLEDRPSKEYFPHKCEELDSVQRNNLIRLATKQLVNEFVDLEIPCEKKSSKSQTKNQKSSKSLKESKDGVYAYACGLLANGLLLMELKDGTREGDGNRIMRCYLYMFLIFKATNRRNYAIEAFNTLLHLRYFFSPRMAAQLKWSRTINVHGREGKNIPADLHMEHLNKECKTILSGMGSNITEESVLRVSRALKPLTSIMSSFDKNNEVPQDSGLHTTKSSATDLNKVVTQLFRDSKVFVQAPLRTHTQFLNFTPNVMMKLDHTDLKKWMDDRARNLLVYH